ncbi:MAG TPA: zinc-ribbon domain-containing protein [Pirellulales bacterium]|jgi:Zn-finger nucleic acid-binding protein/ribosomal protein L40E|nr:zinc-ribbon domain-containing protein [Pirellulales bacterium]
MRVLTRCPKCLRQYDVSQRPAGSRLRCLCGAVLTVEAPVPHDASVVRCASCGAPREAGASFCKFCGSDFTLAELELNTICPNCYARVSDSAKFCHHCGTAILPALPLTQASTLVCPACAAGHKLTSRRLDEFNMLECGHCAGMWLSTEVFNLLTRKAECGEGLVKLLPALQTEIALAAPLPAGSLYRKCPICQGLMVRKNFGKKSGVIIDWCGDHGIWFDNEELSQLLEWIHSGAWSDVKAEERRRAKEAEHAATLPHAGPRPDLLPPTFLDPANRSFLDRLRDAIGELLEW